MDWSVTRSVTAAMVSVSWLGIGCSSDGGGSPAPSCGPVPRNECPDAGAPSFAQEVFSVLDEKCNVCHAHDPKLWPLTDYSHVSDWRSQIETTVAGCTMPPSGSSVALTEDERRQILIWTICGAPDN